MKRSCFTLVELLVVVAIIALLVSILLPTLNKAKEQTRRVICASNLRNCGTALHIYAASNDGYIPAFNKDNSLPDWYDPHIYYREGQWDLREYMRPYIGNFEVWKCPALPMAASIDDPANTKWQCYGTYRYFPGRRYPQFAEYGTDQYDNPKPLSDRYETVDNAAGQVILQDAFVDDWTGWTDTVRFNHGAGRVVRHFEQDVMPSYACKSGPLAAADGANLLFYDGRAEWVGSRNLEIVGRCADRPDPVMTYSVLP